LAFGLPDAPPFWADKRITARTQGNDVKNLNTTGQLKQTQRQSRRNLETRCSFLTTF
jgi:hypothetical protein